MVSKARTYVLFEHNKYFKFYLRGAYYNAQMNKILCPDTKTIIYVDTDLCESENNYRYFDFLRQLDFARIVWFGHKHLCSSMLMRLKPIVDYDVISCRDIDAITTLRDVESVDRFVESDAIAHGINDNPAHSIPLMGGMCSFKKEAMENVDICAAIVSNLDAHGQDQEFLMREVYPKVKDRFLLDKIISLDSKLKSNRANPLWESDLCCSFIGSAGINEMETLRFFERQGIDWQSFTSKFPEIFV